MNFTVTYINNELSVKNNVSQTPYGIAIHMSYLFFLVSGLFSCFLGNNKLVCFSNKKYTFFLKIFA